MVATSKPRRQSEPGRQTRTRVIEATLQTVRSKGLVGASARAIARAGDFNQALVFYHFGSIEELLLEAVDFANQRRIEQFGPDLDQANTMADLMAIIERLLSARSGADHAAISAIVGGWPPDSAAGRRLLKLLGPWDDRFHTAAARCLPSPGTPSVLTTDDLAHLTSAMMYGVEMIRRVDGGAHKARSALAPLRRLAATEGP